MSESSTYSFELSEWTEYQDKIIAIREDVYIRELDLDVGRLVEATDPESYHIIAYSKDGLAIGAGCIHPNGRIGDVVVLKPWRDKTVGEGILISLLKVAKVLEIEQVWIETTQKIVEFYQSKKLASNGEAELMIENNNKCLH